METTVVIGTALLVAFRQLVGMRVQLRPLVKWEAKVEISRKNMKSSHGYTKLRSGKGRTDQDGQRVVGLNLVEGDLQGPLSQRIFSRNALE